MMTTTQRLGTTLLLFLLSLDLRAQLTITGPSAAGTSSNGSGQSFTPGDAGTFPTASAYLTGMTFKVGTAISSSYYGVATYLDIYSDNRFTTYVGSSSTSQSWNAGDAGTVKTWSFDNLELNKASTYYAVFSLDDEAGSLTTRSIGYNSGSYSGGVMIERTRLNSGYDTAFTATFSAVAVPEPGTFAVIAGGLGLGLAWWRRRGRRQPASAAR